MRTWVALAVAVFLVPWAALGAGDSEPAPDVSNVVLPLMQWLGPGGSREVAPFHPAAGAWVKYRYHDKKDRLVQEIRVAIVPPELKDGRYWLELDESSGPFSASVAMLLAGSPYMSKNLIHVVLYPPGVAMPVDLPVRSLLDGIEKASPRARQEVPEKSSKPRRIGDEVLKTAAGSIHATHYRLAAKGKGKHGDLWVAPGVVPLFGLVRSSDPDQETELIGYGTSGAGARVPIPDEPEAIPEDQPASSRPAAPAGP